MDPREFFNMDDGFTRRLRLPAGTYINVFFDTDYVDGSGVSTVAPSALVLSEDIAGVLLVNDIVQLNLVDYRVHTIEDDNGGTVTLRLFKVS